MPLGVQISLFDVSNISNPTLIQNSVIDEESYSEVQYDYHAFRYLHLNKVVIIPVSVYPRFSENMTDLFDGFFIYYVDEDEGIHKIKDVVHADESFVSLCGCFSSAYLEPRSMVFDSKLVTFKGHTVINSGDIFSTNSTEWLINFDEDYKDDESCSFWF